MIEKADRQGLDQGALPRPIRQPQQPRRASLGELEFDASVEPEMRETIREMWVNRLAGFHARDLERYLRDNSDTTRYIKDGRCFTSKTFRRAVRWLFRIESLTAIVGLRLTAEALDPIVTREGDGYVTRATLVLWIGRRIIRQSDLTMSIKLRGSRWVWDTARDTRLRRGRWRYACKLRNSSPQQAY